MICLGITGFQVAILLVVAVAIVPTQGRDW